MISSSSSSESDVDERLEACIPYLGYWGITASLRSRYPHVRGLPLILMGRTLMYADVYWGKCEREIRWEHL